MTRPLQHTHVDTRGPFESQTDVQTAMTDDSRFVCSAHQQRPHPRREEGVRVPLGRVFAGAEALQGPVHAGGPHEAPHGGEAAQMHSKN